MEAERGQVHIGGSDDFSAFSMRVTSVFRFEDDAWKLVHRQADLIISLRPANIVIRH